MSLCMTGSDLNSSSKPWAIQRKVSDIVYAEFHEQGDVEKSLGWKPIPLFDSNNFPELASMQVYSTRTFLNAHLFYFKGWILWRYLHSLLRAACQGDASSPLEIKLKLK